MLDEFAAKVVWRKRQPRLPRTFFQDRIMDDSAAHMKAFAGETLAWIDVLALFLDMVLEPAGALPEHALCFKHLRDMVQILAKGGEATHHLVALGAAIAAHHGISLRLYSESAKPKLHYFYPHS